MIYLVYERSTGFVVSSITANSKPAVMAQHDTVVVTTIPDFTQVKVVNGKVVPLVIDPAVLEATLIRRLKNDAELLKMDYLSSGGAKKAEYAQKRAEVAAWDSLGGTTTAILAALNLLPQATKDAKFGFAQAEATLRGEPNISAAIARFRAGLVASSKIYTLAAIELKAVDSIKAATTSAAKQAAYDSVKWT